MSDSASQDLSRLEPRPPRRLILHHLPRFEAAEFATFFWHSGVERTKASQPDLTAIGEMLLQTREDLCKGSLIVTLGAAVPFCEVLYEVFPMQNAWHMDSS